MNRDHRNGGGNPVGKGYSEAWAQGIISRFQSGFTKGTFGVGVDAFAILGKLGSIARKGQMILSFLSALQSG